MVDRCREEKAAEPGSERGAKQAEEKKNVEKNKSVEKKGARAQQQQASGGFFFFPCFPSLLPRLPLFSTTAIALVLPRAQTISPSLCSQRLRKEGKRRTRQRERGEDARSISHLMKKKPLASQPLNSDTALPPRPTHRSDPSSPARRASSSADRLDWRATRSAAAMVKTGVL